MGINSAKQVALRGLSHLISRDLSFSFIFILIFTVTIATVLELFSLELVSSEFLCIYEKRISNIIFSFSLAVFTLTIPLSFSAILQLKHQHDARGKDVSNAKKKKKHKELYRLTEWLRLTSASAIVTFFTQFIWLFTIPVQIIMLTSLTLVFTTIIALITSIRLLTREVIDLLNVSGNDAEVDL